MIFDNEQTIPQTGQRRSKVTNPTTYSGLGKLPPQAVDLEEAVLGALMLEKQNDASVWVMVKPEIFYRDNHQYICKAIIQLRAENAPIDILTVTAKLRALGELELVGGAYYITELTNRVASGENIVYHLKIIYQKFIQRETIRISSESINTAYDDTSDVFDLIAHIRTSISGLLKNIFTNKAKNSKQLANELRQDLLKEKKNGLLGPGTGIRGIDKVLKGDAPGDFRLIEGATSMGKSALACSEVVNCCFETNKDGKIQLKEQQIGVAVFNLEMVSLKYSIRLISNISSIDKDTIALNRFTKQELERYHYYLGLYERAEIFIDDCEDGITINEFEYRVAELVEKHGVYKIVIDTIQLMKPDPSLMKINNTRELQLADISRRIKACAKRHNIVLIGVAQLNDEVRRAKNNKPTLGMIRECKAIEHDADNVIFVWRPFYYDELKDTLKEVNCSYFNVTITDFNNMAFIIVGKNREGDLPVIPVSFKGNLMRISDHPLIIDAINNMGSGIDTNQTEVTF